MISFPFLCIVSRNLFGVCRSKPDWSVLNRIGSGVGQGQVRSLGSTCTFRAGSYRLSWARTPIISWAVCLAGADLEGGGGSRCLDSSSPPPQIREVPVLFRILVFLQIYLFI